MSNAVFPTLPGLKWGAIKTPQWSTSIQRSASGRELRASYYSHPTYRYALSYEVLRAGALAELQTMVGFFNARQGSFDSFLFEDPNDNTAALQQIGTGNGVRKQFQLIRSYGGFVEPVVAIKGAPVLLADGVAIDPVDYSINPTGMVTFDDAPAEGVVLRWSGAFYYRCRFIQDSAEFEEFLHHLWSARRIEFTTLKYGA